MSCRFTAHLATPTGWLVKVFYADTMLADGGKLRFRQGHRVVESLLSTQVRMLFREADDRVGVAQSLPH